MEGWGRKEYQSDADRWFNSQDRLKGNLAVRTCSFLCFILLFIFCYFIRFKIFGYKYMFIVSKKDNY